MLRLTRVRIGFVLFPNLTQLDFTGPLQVLHRVPNATTLLVAKTLDPVPSDCGLSLVPTAAFADCPALDLLCVPGGFGVQEALADSETLDFVRHQGLHAKYVTSVCTGAFLLGAAGLLEGKRATTHWAYHHLLPLVGATPVQSRVVREGHTITGGGVTAGIDFALTVAAELAGDEVARTIQLSLEYDPSPPFASGSPSIAAPSTVEALRARYAPRLETFTAALERVRPAR